MPARYALVTYTSPDGETYEPGQKLEVRTDSEQEKVTDQRLIDDKVYAKTKPAGVSNRPSARGEQETS